MAATSPHDSALGRDPFAGGAGSVHQGRSITAILFGLFLVVAGVLFTVANFVALPFSPTLLDLMPALFGIVAVDRLLAGRQGAALGWVFAGAALAVLLFSGESFDLRQVFRLWPIVLVLCGISLVLRAVGGKGKRACGRQGELAFLSSLRNVIDDPAYTGGACISVMGGQRLDLRQATLFEGGALIQVFVMWGGVDIVVPEGWSVSTQVFTALGGCDDKSKSAHALPAGMPQLVVRGVVLMGGLEIHN